MSFANKGMSQVFQVVAPVTAAAKIKGNFPDLGYTPALDGTGAGGTGGGPAELVTFIVRNIGDCPAGATAAEPGRSSDLTFKVQDTTTYVAGVPASYADITAAPGSSVLTGIKPGTERVVTVTVKKNFQIVIGGGTLAEIEIRCNRPFNVSNF